MTGNTAFKELLGDHQHGLDVVLVPGPGEGIKLRMVRIVTPLEFVKPVAVLGR